LIAIPKRILWATDLSELSLHSGRYAAALAEQLDAELWIVHVFEPPLTPGQYVSSAGGGAQTNPDIEAIETCRGSLTELVGAELPGPRVGVPEIVFGEPWQAICEYGERVGVDLIVLSTHGRTGFKHAVLGSTAERVVQHAPCSVLAVKIPRHHAAGEGNSALCQRETA